MDAKERPHPGPQPNKKGPPANGAHVV